MANRKKSEEGVRNEFLKFDVCETYFISDTINHGEEVLFRQICHHLVQVLNKVLNGDVWIGLRY